MLSHHAETWLRACADDLADHVTAKDSSGHGNDLWLAVTPKPSSGQIDNADRSSVLFNNNFLIAQDITDMPDKYVPPCQELASSSRKQWLQAVVARGGTHSAVASEARSTLPGTCRAVPASRGAQSAVLSEVVLSEAVLSEHALERSC